MPILGKFCQDPRILVTVKMNALILVVRVLPIIQVLHRMKDHVIQILLWSQGNESLIKRAGKRLLERIEGQEVGPI